MLIEKIIMLGGQINAPSENATVHAPYTQLSAAAPELLNSLLKLLTVKFLISTSPTRFLPKMHLKF